MAPQRRSQSTTRARASTPASETEPGAGHGGRPLWTGSLSFGLVSIPVSLYVAVAPHDVHFHQLSKGGERIRYKRVAESSGKEIPYPDIVKGYELHKGKFVVIEPQELATLEPKKNRTIEIQQFVHLDEIDPAYWDQTYYLGPTKQGGAQKSYELMRRAMEESGKVAIGRFVMRTKEYLVAVRPLDGALAIETMFYPDEIRDQKAIPNLPKHVSVTPAEVQLAKQLIDALTSKWDPNKQEDTYQKQVMDLIRKKSRGQEITATGPEAAAAPEITDLMEALKRSLNRPARASTVRSTSSRRGKPRTKHGERRQRAA